MAFASFILHAILLLQFSFGINALEPNRKTLENGHKPLSPSQNVFFRVEDLHQGKTMPVFIANPKDNSTRAPLISKQQADSIPFSSSKLPYLLQLFSFPKTSPQAKAMDYTLTQCELGPIPGEIQFCATSFESLLEKIRNFFGTDQPKVLTTKISSSKHAVLQRYSFIEEPLEFHASKMLACHDMPYPYLVYYCHGQKSGMTRVFKIALGGENEERVDSVAVCHKDTSMWDPNQMAFKVLGGYPGGSPVCHFIPADNLVWVV